MVIRHFAAEAGVDVVDDPLMIAGHPGEHDGHVITRSDSPGP